MTTDNIYFEKIYNASLPSFGLPTYPKDFFIWVWEEFYNDESYTIDDLSEYVENNDFNKLLRIMPYTRNI